MKTFKELREESLAVDIFDKELSKAVIAKAKKVKKLIDAGKSVDDAISSVIAARIKGRMSASRDIKIALIKNHGMSKKEVGMEKF